MSEYRLFTINSTKTRYFKIQLSRIAVRLRWVLGLWTAFVSFNLNPPSGQSGSGELYKQSISGGAPILVDDCSKTGGCEKVTF